MKGAAVAIALILGWGSALAQDQPVKDLKQIYETMDSIGLLDEFVYDSAEIEGLVSRFIRDDQISHGVVLEYCFHRVDEIEDIIGTAMVFAMQTSLSVMLYQWSMSINDGQVTPELVALDRALTNRKIDMMRAKGTYQGFASAKACQIIARAGIGTLT